jgi:hypothetical protein
MSTTENISFFTSSVHLRHIILACSPADLPASLLSALPLEKMTLVESIPLPEALTSLPLRTTKLPTLFTPPPPSRSRSPRMSSAARGGGGDGGRNGPHLQLSQQEDPDGGTSWLVIRPERSKSQGAALKRRSGNGRDRSEDDESSLSISIGPDNTVSVDSGRRRRIMG